MNRSERVKSLGIVARSDRDLAEQFRAIAEQGGAIAWIIDCADCMPSYISPAVEQLLGYDLADFQHHFGGKDSDDALAELCGGLPARLQRFAAGDLSRKQLLREFDQRHKAGHIVPIEVASSLMVDETGCATALVGTIRDLSAQREHGAERRRFASMLNHEFRTPLSTIDGAIQRLEVTGAHADDATRQRYRKIANAVDRLIAMLDEYLSPERLEAIGRSRQPGAMEPRLLLEEGAHQARAAGRSVEVEAGELPGNVRCEPQGLRLAFKVLVDNAIRYSPPESLIVLAGRRAAGGIELTVRDRGIGVPEDETERIFDKFYRARNAPGAGSGLGLYMARSVVEVHGGMLGMRKLDQGGTEFRIWLPARNVTGKSVASDGFSSDNSVNTKARRSAET